MFRPLPIPLVFFLIAALLSMVPAGPKDGPRSRLVGLILIQGLMIGAHLEFTLLRDLALKKGPYAVFFWALIAFVSAMTVYAWLEWIGWFVR